MSHIFMADKDEGFGITEHCHSWKVIHTQRGEREREVLVVYYCMFKYLYL